MRTASGCLFVMLLAACRAHPAGPTDAAREALDAAPGPPTRDAGHDMGAADVGPSSPDAWPPARDAYIDPARAVRASLVQPTLLVHRWDASLPADLAYVIDPEAATIHAVDLATLTDWPVALPEGSEPGRAVLDAYGRLHVVLRTQGSVATLDRSLRLFTRPVCAAPRGIDVGAETLFVACGEGVIVRMPVDGADTVVLPVGEDDLDDIDVFGASLLVTRRRAGEVLTVSATTGAIEARWSPPPWDGPDPLAPPGDTTSVAHYVPRVALNLRDGYLLHQMHRVTPIPAPSGSTTTTPTYAPSGTEPIGCAAIVISAISAVPTRYWPTTSTTLLPIVGATDFTHAGMGGRFMTEADRTFLINSPLGTEGTTPVAVRCDGISASAYTGRTVAVAPVAPDVLLVVTRYPLSLLVSMRGHEETIVLETRPTENVVGRDLFVLPSPSGVACTSCHADGGDDGHVWTHAPGMPLRTISMRGHVLDTPPFHWEGDLPDFHSLVDEVWVQRMGGTALGTTGESALASFIAALETPPPSPENPAGVERGRALFESADLGCTACHGSDGYPTAVSQDVGTGGAFQVPHLRGLAYRAPYMHDGCAATLRERFVGDPACTGGDLHGHTGGLSDADVDDVVAFLRTL